MSESEYTWEECNTEEALEDERKRAKKTKKPTVSESEPVKIERVKKQLQVAPVDTDIAPEEPKIEEKPLPRKKRADKGKPHIWTPARRAGFEKMMEGKKKKEDDLRRERAELEVEKKRHRDLIESKRAERRKELEQLKEDNEILEEDIKRPFERKKKEPAQIQDTRSIEDIFRETMKSSTLSREEKVRIARQMGYAK